MPRRYDPRKLRRAIGNYNAAVRRYNSEVQRQRTQFRRAIDGYNRQVRAHNSSVAASRRALRAQLDRLATVRVVTHSTTYYQSVRTVHASYEAVEQSAPGTWLEDREDILDLAARETRNSLEVADAIDNSDEPSASTGLDLDPHIRDHLMSFSADLADRWDGALFALDSRNPDAARHFSSSSREILSRIIEDEAPDDEVVRNNPSAQLTQDGRPTRRERLAYCLVRAGRTSETLVAFADADVSNVVELFQVFNDGTHGHAGLYDLTHLGLIKTRVEGAIEFLHSILR